MATTPEEKRAKLARLLAEKAGVARRAPASFAQERMWFLEQWSPGSALFNMPAVVRLTGALDPDALGRGLQVLVERHETLRTTLREREGQPVQVIAPSLVLKLEREDLRGVPEAEREAHAWRAVTRDAQRPFVLSEGPLVRATLYALAEEEHLLLLNLHHAIADGWSMGVLVRELAAVYAAARAGTSARLEALPLQYADFAAWQRATLQGEALESQLSWWRGQLDPDARLELPADKARPATLGSAGARQFLTLSRELTQTLRDFSQRHGTTLFVVWVSAFLSLVYRYTGQEDVALGTLVSGRDRAELEGLIGLFINTLVLRTPLSGALRFRELMARVGDTVSEAQAHQGVPFEKLVETLKPERSSSHLPLFQVMVIHQNAPGAVLQQEGLTLEVLPVTTDTTKHDLTLYATELPQGLRLSAEYSTDLFEAPTVARLLAHLRTVLVGALAAPDTALRDLPLLSEAERRQLLVDWHGARQAYPEPEDLASLVEAQVARTPDRVALTFGDATLTYAQLDARANQLAHRLREWGVGPESRVGVCLERSLELVVSLLAVLKAGGAYVPFDPGYPAQRLTWMFQDARPTVLLAQEHLVPGLPPHGARVVCVDAEAEALSRLPAHAPARQPLPDALAYIIFTSGSTGRPKGAMNAHRGVCNRLRWMQTEYRLGADDGVLQKTPFSFDVSVWEFFWPLMTGARLVIARPGGHQEPAYLARLIREAGVTTLHFVPSMLQVFLEEPEARGCASLRRVVCSGEALSLELKERCLQVLPHAGLHNLYGPTEAAVDVTYFACTSGDGRRSVPIGRAVANTSILILDPVFQPVPVGVAGELYIGGVQVGRGYQSRPDLTAERFLPDLFSALPGARMYRTGDVARWLPDGEVEYLGRADFQVKVRGLRIELGEIEAALEQHPTVRQSVVLAREDMPGDKRLVAYVAGRAGQTLDVDGLKASLQARLPEYMVPTSFVVLDALPLSPNGKVDRKALPAPTLERAAQEARVPPQTPTEEVIAALFGELLGVADVGARDDLFRLGGNSLLATRVLARLRARFGVELSLRVLFQHPTVRQLARCVDDARAGTAAPVERAAPARERYPVLPLTEDTAPEDTGGPPAREPAAPVLSAEERHRVLVTWNDTAKDYPRDACLHHLVEAQARRTPDAVAVVAGPVRLTYRELEQRSGRLARRLRALGVGPEVRVGLCVERNADMVVGMLGILKAGGAYVPLDPTYPRERLAFLLEDARGPALVAHAHLVPALPAHTCQVVCLEDDAEPLGQASPDASLTLAPLPENLAYLIYTSGSTGRPKGVAIPHRAAVAFITWVHGVYSAEELQGVLACTSLNFDLSVFEVFAPLTRGGRVILARNALHLAELPQASEVTLVNTVPSAMAQLLRLGALPPSVRTLNLAGEALPASLARQVFDTPTVQRLYNLYGPSEDTTYSTFARVRPGEVPPIGRPLSNTRAYVLDADLRPVPVGQPGALYLAGEGQSRGYLHRPDLTAERFLPEPFGPPGSRMYKTGDRVRYRPDGTLEYLGRDDFQVKVRGFRIEPGEVEAAVQAVPGVREAVVLAREDVPGDKRLVAYVVARDGRTLDAAALKDGLRRTLPEYMVPTAFVVLDALPLNPNGKVDRKALPVPVLERASPRPYEAPRTPTQQLLAGLWRQVLGVERVGLTDHFFELGGHSLLATQVVSRLRASLRVELPLEAFFHAPTLQALAARVDAARDAGDATPAVPPLLPAPRTGRLPLSFAQQRLWLLDRLEPGGSAYTLLAALRLTGPLHTRALVRSFHALHQRHESLRTVFHEDAQGPLQVVLPELPPALGFVDLGGVPEAEREREALALAAAQAEVPFDLARGPLVRGLLVRLGARHHLLVVTLHHIISDGWSSAVLTRELSALYEAFSADQPPALPALPLQYVDYTLWQRAWLTEDVLASQLAYWRRQLAGAPAALELPTDHPRPDVQTFRGGRVPVRLGLPLSESVKALGHREGVTPFMVLLAGLQALLSRLSGQEEVVVGSPIAGRPAPELEDMLGCFVNTLALRTRVDAGEGFRALLARVREVTLGAYAHQDAPFDRVVEAVRPAREPGRSPLFQVLFVLENAPVSQPMGPGLSLSFVDVERQSAKFDLTLALWEEPETGLTGVLEYNRDLFDPGTATRWAGQLRALLEQAVLTPDAPLSRLRAGIAPAELLVPLQPQGTRPPFFCVHAIGGTVWGYAELARQLGEDQPFHGLQAPGLESGQPTVDSLEDLAALYVEAMRTVRPHGPYRLGGWSMGALIAFEMARQLLRQGEQVERLVFIEPSPTSYARGQRVDDPTTQGQLFTVNLAHTTGLPETLPPDVPPGDSHRLLRYLLEAGQRTGVFGAEVGLAWLQRRQRVFNACLAALSGHVLEPLGVPVWLLRGTEANVDEGGDRTRGWAALTADPRVVDVPGTHYSVLQSPQVEVLGRALARVLESPPEESSSPTEAGTERTPTTGPRP